MRARHRQTGYTEHEHLECTVVADWLPRRMQMTIKFLNDNYYIGSAIVLRSIMVQVASNDLVWHDITLEIIYWLQ